MATYRYCCVPMCTSSSLKTPEKIFLTMPLDPVRRKKWCSVMKRRDSVSEKSHMHVCEDHFDLENDVENYMRYKLQGVRLSLKKDAMPHIFQCQKLVKAPAPSTGRAQKRKRRQIVEELLNASTSSASPSIASTLSSVASTSSTTLASTSSSATSSSGLAASLSQDALLIDSTSLPLQLHKSVQAAPKFRSKATNTSRISSEAACSPIKWSSASTATSPLKSYTMEKELDFSFEDPSDSDYQPEEEDSQTECEVERELQQERLKLQMRECFLLSIEKDPKLFLGLPPSCYFLISFLHDKVNCSVTNIMITLKKIKLNDSYAILAHHFGLSTSSIGRIVTDTVYYLAAVLQNFIFWPDAGKIESRLPIAFRARFSKVCSIIDCFEIEIEKPSHPVHQSVTWSNYYNCNTIKYLISCTPDGLVSFISSGYGGRATDTHIVQDSGYLDLVPSGLKVMADRGFKNISNILNIKGCELVRPPSVSAEHQSTQDEVKQAKRIAALRIHVERVIGRVREFSMLLPHSCVDNHFVHEFDKIVIIVCGLINLQSNIVKY